MKILPDETKFHLLEFNIGLAFKKSQRFGDACEAFARSLGCSPTFDKAFTALAACAKEAETKGQTFNVSLVNQALQKFRDSQAQKAS